LDWGVSVQQASHASQWWWSITDTWTLTACIKDHQRGIKAAAQARSSRRTHPTQDSTLTAARDKVLVHCFLQCVPLPPGNDPGDREKDELGDGVSDRDTDRDRDRHRGASGGGRGVESAVGGNNMN
jgi:hypothetical protein